MDVELAGHTSRPDTARANMDDCSGHLERGGMTLGGRIGASGRVGAVRGFGRGVSPTTFRGLSRRGRGGLLAQDGRLTVRDHIREVHGVKAYLAMRGTKVDMVVSTEPR